MFTVLIHAQAPVSWEPVDVTPVLVDGKQSIPSETIESIQRNKVALKGPLAVGSLALCRKISEQT